MRNYIQSKRGITAEAICLDSDRIWISEMGFNGLYCYDINKKENSFVARFPEEKNNVWRLHRKAMKIENEIYFLPDRSHFIHVFDTYTRNIKTVDIKMDERTGSGDALYKNGKIYFICGIAHPMMYIFDVKTQEINMHKLDSGKVCPNLICIEDKLYFVYKDKNIIAEFSIKDYSVSSYIIPCCNGGFGTLSHDGRFFWLTDTKNIIRWDKESKETKQFNSFPPGYGMTIKEDGKIITVEGFTDKYKYKEKEKPFNFSVIIQNNLFLFPFRTNMIIKLNIENGIMEEVFLPNEQEEKESLFTKARITHCHYVGGLQNDKLIFTSTKSKNTYIWESIDGKFEKYHFWASEPKDLTVYKEGMDCSFIDYIVDLIGGNANARTM